MGPMIDEELWSPAVAKWWRRTVQIAISGMPTSLSVSAYEKRAVPTLYYLMQVKELPKVMDRRERMALHRVWRFGQLRLI